MTPTGIERPAPAVAWSILAVTFAASTAALVLASTPATLYLVVRNGQFEADVVPYTAAFLALTIVGGLLAARRPGNPLGWIVAIAGVLPAIAMLAYQYAILGLVTAPGILPGAVAAAWLANWTFMPALGLLMVAVPLLFPTGAPPSRRWRPVLWAGLAVVILAAVGEALAPGPLGFIQEVAVTNPVGVVGFPDVLAPVGGIFGAYTVLAVLALASLVVRFRRADVVERQQVKWLLYTIAVGLAALLVSEVVIDASRFGDTLAAEALYLAGAAVLWVGPPVAIWIAVTRHRLYEIDRLVNRTLVYTGVTALLAGVYAAGVLGLGAVVPVVTGGGGGDLVVATSTLTVAAAFGPLRRRVQVFVDRRFNRARYDAVRTVEAFAQTLRDEVQLDDLLTSLSGVTARTLGPRHVHLWLARQDAR